jgi:hypothetical protein
MRKFVNILSLVALMCAAFPFAALASLSAGKSVPHQQSSSEDRLASFTGGDGCAGCGCC